MAALPVAWVQTRFDAAVAFTENHKQNCTLFTDCCTLQPRLQHELHKEGVAPVSIVTTQAPLLHEAGALIHPPRSNAARVDVQHDRGRRGASEGPPKLRNTTAKQRSAYAPSSEGLLAQKELWCGAAACQP